MKAAQATETTPAAGNGAGIDLKITVRDKDGRIVNEQCKEGDIYLYNWAIFIAHLFKVGFAGSAAKPYYAIRKADGVQLSGPSPVYGRNNGGQWGGGGKICLGASVQAATIRDYDLAAPVLEVTPSVPNIQQAGNTLKVVISGTASFAAETTLSECALAVSLPWSSSDNSSNRVIITRDTFTATTVPAGGTITLQFELWFNAMPA